MSEMLTSIKTIDDECRKSEIDVCFSILEYELKQIELLDDSDVVQEGVFDTIAKTGMSYATFASLLSLLGHGLTSAASMALSKILGADSKIAGGILSGANIITHIGIDIIASKYRKRVVTRELMEELNNAVNLLIEKIDDKGDIKYIVDTKFKEFRGLVSAIVSNLEFSINKKVHDSSLNHEYREYLQAAKKFNRYTSNERILNFIHDDETDKLKIVGKKKSKNQNARQLPDFVKATHKFLTALNDAVDDKSESGTEDSED